MVLFTRENGVGWWSFGPEVLVDQALVMVLCWIGFGLGLVITKGVYLVVEITQGPILYFLFS